MNKNSIRKTVKVLFISTISVFIGWVGLHSAHLFQKQTYISDDFLSKINTPYGWRYANLNKEAVLNLTGPRQDEYLLVITDQLSVLNNSSLESYSRKIVDGIASNILEPSISNPERLKVNGFTCVMQQVNGKFKADDSTVVGISYTLAHIQGKKAVYQIHYWTDANLYAERFETHMQILESFVELPGYNVTSETWELIENIRLSQMIQKLPETFNKVMVTTFGKSSKLEKLGSTTFPEKQLKSEIALYIANTNSPGIVKKMNRFYADSLYQKIKIEEQKAFSAPQQQAKATFIEKLKSKNRPKTPRINLVRDIIKYSGYAELKSNLTMGIMELVVYTYLNYNQQEYNTTTIQSKLISQRKGVLSKYKNDLLDEYLFAYRSLSDVELKKYVSFLDTEEGRYSIRLSRNIVAFLLNRADRNISRAL